MKDDESRIATIDGPRPSSLPATTTQTRVRTIVVNGAAHAFDGDTIDRGQLAALAFPDTAPSSTQGLTVAFRGGPPEASTGLLPVGRSAVVHQGQTFSVSITDKS